jgi:hypothetical protein
MVFTILAAVAEGERDRRMPPLKTPSDARCRLASRIRFAATGAARLRTFGPAKAQRLAD